MTDTTVEKLMTAFPSGVKGHSEFRDTTTIYVNPDQFHEVALFLRADADLQYNLLVDIYGTDRLKLGNSPRFAANYELYSIPKNQFLRVIVEAPDPTGNGSSSGKTNGRHDDLPLLPTVTDIWPTADWLERETYDLMGIEFSHHPWMHRIMMPDNWVGHPLRKDYPLGGEPVYFEHDRHNPRFAHLGKQIMVGPSFITDLPEDMDTEEHMVLNLGPHHPATQAASAPYRAPSRSDYRTSPQARAS